MFFDKVKSEPLWIKEADRLVGITETGNNRGKIIDSLNNEVGIPLGSPYCATFISHCLRVGKSIYPRIRSGYSRAFITTRSITVSQYLRGKKLPPYCLVIWVRPRGGHIGFATSWSGNSGKTIEANTSSGLKGSQHDGSGIFRRFRQFSNGKFRITHFTPVY